MSDRAPTLGRDISDELAERLFTAAFECFSEKGFERTTMDDVAARAGVARATLYYYFRGKEELFFFLLQRGIDLLRTAVQAVTAEGGTGRERLERALDLLVDLLIGYRDVLRVAMQQFGRIERHEESNHGWFHEQAFGPIRDIITAGFADGTLRKVDPDCAAAAMFGGVAWGVMHHIEEGAGVDPAALKAQMRALFVEGLGV